MRDHFWAINLVLAYAGTLDVLMYIGVHSAHLALLSYYSPQN